jgi:hypothetical protein
MKVFVKRKTQINKERKDRLWDKSIWVKNGNKSAKGILIDIFQLGGILDPRESLIQVCKEQ